MNKNSIIFLHNNNMEVFKDILKMCQKSQLNLYECSSLGSLLETIKIVNPLCIAVDEDYLSRQDISNLAKQLNSKFIFLLGTCYFEEKNLISCDSIKDFENKLHNLRSRIDQNPITDKKLADCYEFITNQLSELNFSIKHIGTSYMKEVVVQLYKSPASLHCCLNDLYPLISSKYNCKEKTIERSIRFAIKEADKIETFTNNPNFKQKPTIRQLANYLLDKFLATQF